MCSMRARLPSPMYALPRILLVEPLMRMRAVPRSTSLQPGV